MRTALNQRIKEQSGFGLVVIIGVVAALAIMASTLVMITANVQSNTADERTRGKAFDVAEGAMDYYMSQLASSWPKASMTAPSFDLTTFRGLGQFASMSEYPNPGSGMGTFATAACYDNDVTVNGVPNVGYTTSSPQRDQNGDGKLWVVSRGATNAKAASIQSEVTRVPVNTQFPEGIAVWAGGNLTSNGGGNNPKVWVETAPVGSQVSSYVGGTIDTTSVFDVSAQKSPIPITPSGPSIDNKAIPTLDSLIPQAMIEQIIDLAKTMGTYFDTTQSGVTMPTNFSGICVIRVADGANVSIGNNGTINSLASPGILLILGPEGGSGNNITLDMGGNNEFWGVLYTDGRFYSSHGTPTIHGMLVCKSNLDMRGTPNVEYNSQVIGNLAGSWTLTVALVPNTWREIKP